METLPTEVSILLHYKSSIKIWNWTKKVRLFSTYSTTFTRLMARISHGSCIKLKFGILNMWNLHKMNQCNCLLLVENAILWMKKILKNKPKAMPKHVSFWVKGNVLKLIFHWIKYWNWKSSERCLLIIMFVVNLHITCFKPLMQVTFWMFAPNLNYCLYVSSYKCGNFMKLLSLYMKNLMCLEVVCRNASQNCKVQLLYKQGYVIPCVCKLTVQKVLCLSEWLLEIQRTY
jgi:hypothetical protein